MQWSTEKGAGFSPGEPWLPINPDWRERNVELQLRDPLSVLSRYRELIALRRSHHALREGRITFLDAGKDLLAFVREATLATGETERIFVLLNFSSSPRSGFIEEDAMGLLLDEGRGKRMVAGPIKLRGLEAIIARLGGE
jgi:glycosidase